MFITCIICVLTMIFEYCICATSYYNVFTMLRLCVFNMLYEPYLNVNSFVLKTVCMKTWCCCLLYISYKKAIAGVNHSNCIAL
jgi:hypothetical protein